VLVLGRVVCDRLSVDDWVEPSSDGWPDPTLDFTVVEGLDDAVVVVVPEPVSVSVSLAGTTLAGGVPATVVDESSWAGVDGDWASAAAVVTEVVTVGTVSLPTSGPRWLAPRRPMLVAPAAVAAPRTIAVVAAMVSAFLRCIRARLLVSRHSPDRLGP
jgi:hypothetical protein